MKSIKVICLKCSRVVKCFFSGFFSEFLEEYEFVKEKIFEEVKVCYLLWFNLFNGYKYLYIFIVEYMV